MHAEEIISIYLCVIIMKVCFTCKISQQNTKIWSKNIAGYEEKQRPIMISQNYQYGTCKFNNTESMRFQNREYFETLRYLYPFVQSVNTKSIKIKCLLLYDILNGIYKCCAFMDNFTPQKCIKIIIQEVQPWKNIKIIIHNIFSIPQTAHPSIKENTIKLKILNENLLLIVINYHNKRKHKKVHRRRVHRSVPQNDYNYNDCSLKESTKKISVGVVRSITARCTQKKNTNEFYYNIKWKPPLPTPSPVTSYLISIFIDGMEENPLCFRTLKQDTHFKFNNTVGFNINNWYMISVIAEPVIRKDKKHTEKSVYVTYCPTTPVIKKLSPAKVSLGQNYTFKCEFENVQSPDVTWSFTPQNNCKNSSNITYNNKHIHVSDKSLQITNATEKQQGCYVCRSWILGKLYHTNASLYVNIIIKLPLNGNGRLTAVIGGSTGAIVIVLLLGIAVYIYFKRNEVHLSNIFFIHRRNTEV